MILTARRVDQLDKTKQLCLDANKDVKVHTIELDVSKPDQVKGVLSLIPEELKAVDLLVNNAGLVKGVEKVGEVAQDDIEVIINTNVLGLIGMTQVRAGGNPAVKVEAVKVEGDVGSPAERTCSLTSDSPFPDAPHSSVPLP